MGGSAPRRLHRHSHRQLSAALFSKQRQHAQRSCACKALQVFSPSKLNLFLRIVRRREDGFHDLASLFHVIDLGDTLTFEEQDGSEDSLTCNVADVPTDSSNLVLRALALFRQYTGKRQCFAVNLHKRVPHGAGLGGGSANAATALWAANQLTGQPATDADLLKWSADIGSDISVFFAHGAAYCTGRGEIVEEVAPPVDTATKILLVKPPVGLSTPAIFKALDLERRSTRQPRGILQQLQEAGSITQEACINDLEQPAFDVLPELAQLKQRLEDTQQFHAVFMTGSGSTLVCVGSEEVPAFVREDSSLFAAPVRLITRERGRWYERAVAAPEAAPMPAAA